MVIPSSCEPENSRLGHSCCALPSPCQHRDARGDSPQAGSTGLPDPVKICRLPCDSRRWNGEAFLEVPQPPLTQIPSLHPDTASEVFRLPWDGTSYLRLSTRLAAGNQSGGVTGRAAPTSEVRYVLHRQPVWKESGGGLCCGSRAKGPLWKSRKETFHVRPIAHVCRAHTHARTP
ncbi:hypothetical protein SKAU_G00306390 [Synaphobranchus kaupii]|uniref:Uncharacterized protein n=1 Tax=Synaphobranchus kaupii TaxID=118154 RepID=A0A9Q1EQV2_SYNKA|nr:hypothetical protein SKAU_G00306390 [Synaphobranchus kaupii]